MELNSNIQFLTGVGPVMAKKLERLGIENVRDLLFYYPRRYDDFSKPQTIKSLRLDEDAIIKASIVQIRQSRTRKKWMSIIEALLADDSGQIKAIWFNQPFLMNILKVGGEWLFAGKVGYDFSTGSKNFLVTQYEKKPIILAVYPETAGLSSKYLRRIVQPLLTDIDSQVDDYLPSKLINQEKLIGLAQAIKSIHNPANTFDIDQAKKRIAFDELLLIMLRMLERRTQAAKHQSIKINVDNVLLKTFSQSLPFRLTDDQRVAAWEIICDLAKDRPMNRLLEGDVGSGKTVVAAMAALAVIKAGYQTVWLAPTEILANQHYQNVGKLFKNFKIKIGLQTAANKKADFLRDELMIGTHALLQPGIKFKNLALIIIDEQHRFGVKQRAYLKELSNRKDNLVIPHLLSMTATPIPRTLALSIYGDLDISLIKHLPEGRQKIITKVVAPQNRTQAYDFIRKEMESGRQVFVICPLIEDSAVTGSDKLFDLDRKSAIAEFKKLSMKVFPEFKLGLLHGRMKSKEKAKVMEDFVKNKLNLLVSTAVVEVGVDIANATVMMIEGADHFGLAQLHQFRGRVGRSIHQSYCFLFSETWSEKTRQRLEAMTESNNGFELAEKDLALRGPGELIGIRQSGLPDLKMATLSDRDLVKHVREVAEKLYDGDINRLPKLKEKLIEFEKSTHLE